MLCEAAPLILDAYVLSTTTEKDEESKNYEQPPEPGISISYSTYPVIMLHNGNPLDKGQTKARHGTKPACYRLGEAQGS